MIVVSILLLLLILVIARVFTFAFVRSRRDGSLEVNTDGGLKPYAELIREGINFVETREHLLERLVYGRVDCYDGGFFAAS